MTDDRNRLLWSNVLDGAWLQKHFANRIETITVLLLVIMFYLAVLDGECQVERDLGQCSLNHPSIRTCKSMASTTS